VRYHTPTPSLSRHFRPVRVVVAALLSTALATALAVAGLESILVSTASATTSPALVTVAGSPFNTGNTQSDGVFSRNGKWFATANESQHTVSMYGVTPTSGSLVDGETVTTRGSTPFSLAYSPDDKFLAVANLSSTSISLFSVDQTTGDLSQPQGPFGDTDGAYRIAFSPTSDLLATVDPKTGKLALFTASSQTAFGTIEPRLTKDGTYPVSGSPVSVTFNPSGTLLAVTDSTTTEISVYTVDNTTSSLIPIAGSPFASRGAHPSSAAFSATGGFLAVASRTADKVFMFTVARTTGELAPITSTPSSFTVGLAPTSVSFSGSALAVANYGNATVSVFTMNTSTGSLSQVTGSPFTAGSLASDQTTSTAFSPSGGLLATTNYAGHTITVRSVLTSTAISPNKPFATSGQDVQLTATVSPALSSGAPQGTVKFLAYPPASSQPVDLCTAVPLTNGTATCTTTALPTGTIELKADYTSTDGHRSSTSGTVPFRVVPPPTATVTVSGSMPFHGTPTFTYTVTPLTAPVTGKVTCSEASTGRPLVTLSVGGTYTVKATTCSGLNVSGGYKLDYAAKTDGFTVREVQITATISGFMPYGHAATFNYTATPAGLIAQSNLSCTQTSTGKTINSTLAVGTYAVKATTCSGLTPPTANYTVSYAAAPRGFVVEAVVNVTVRGSMTYGLVKTLSFAHTQSSVPPGAKVTGTLTCSKTATGRAINASLTARTYTLGGSSCSGLATTPGFVIVYTGTATGFVVQKGSVTATVSGSMTYGGTPGFTYTYTSAASGAVITGTVTCSTTSGGAHIDASLVAGTYSVDPQTCSGLSVTGNFTLTYAATSGGFVVSKATPTVSVSASPKQSSYGSVVTYSATVTGKESSPTGAVTFKVGTIPLCSATINLTTHIATCTSRSAPGGADTVTAQYGGNSTYSAFSSSATVTITKAPSTVTLTVSPTTTIAGSEVTYSATVTSAVTPKLPAPTGTVDFKVGSTLLCAGSLTPSSHKASCTSKAAPIGTDRVVAIYLGNSDFATSSTTAVLAVDPAPLAVVTTPLPAGAVGVSYSAAVSATGGISPYSWSLTSGSLPAGLTLSHTGAITGTPTAAGSSSFTVKVTGATSTTAKAVLSIAVAAAPPPAAKTGYRMVAGDGGVFDFGSAQFYGSMGGKPLNQPVVASAANPTGSGYWEVAGDGGIFAFGNAQFHGSMGGKPLNQPVVGMAADPATGGYWEVASDGGIFSFDAPFYGSMGGKPLNAPIVGMAATPTGGGYWLVASDGGIFAFGNAQFHGSMGGKPLNAPIVGMTTDATTGGYWFVSSTGGVFAFDAPFYGSATGHAASPVVGMAATTTGSGYWIGDAAGQVFAEGVPSDGTMTGKPLNEPMVGFAVS